jgi:hypothetical protein
MYKKQMSLQRVICLLSIIASAVVFIYSLGMMTDLFDMLYNMIPDPEDLDSARVAGARIYYDMQGFNRTLLRLSIGMILLSCLLFITNTHSRRKYYIGNYVAVGLNVAAACGVSLWAHQQIEGYKAWYLANVDFAQLERRLSRVGTYTDSTFWFDIHVAVFALALIVAVLLVVNVIWKINVMNGEKRLLEAGKAVRA